MKRFSLGTLMTVITMFALMLVNQHIKERISTRRTEISQIRTQFKLLDSAPKSAIRAKFIDDDIAKYRWRIFLPPEHQYVLKTAFENVPIPPELPTARSTYNNLPRGEFFLEVDYDVREESRRFLIEVESVDGTDRWDHGLDRTSRPAGLTIGSCTKP